MSLAIPIVKRWEGLHKVAQRRPAITVVPYICPAGYWTIGYGHLCGKDHPSIDEAEAEAYLVRDLAIAETGVLRYCPGLALEPEHRRAAIVSWTFNLGVGRLQASTLRRRINQRAWDEAARELRRWVYAGGRVLSGLVARREDEVRLLLIPPTGVQVAP